MFDLSDSPRAGMRSHMREGVKKPDIHIKFKSYKLELLGELGRLTHTFFFCEKTPRTRKLTHD